MTAQTMMTTRTHHEARGGPGTRPAFRQAGPGPDRGAGATGEMASQPRRACARTCTDQQVQRTAMMEGT